MRMFALFALATALLATGCGPGFYDRPIKEADRTVKEVSLRLGETVNDGTYARAELSVVNASPISWNIAVNCRWYDAVRPEKTVGSTKTAFNVPPWTRRHFGVATYAPTRVHYGTGPTAYWMPLPLAFAELHMRCEMSKERHLHV